MYKRQPLSSPFTGFLQSISHETSTTAPDVSVRAELRDTRTSDATAKHSANGAPRIAAADRISNDAYACVSGDSEDSEDSEARRIVYS